MSRSLTRYRMYYLVALVLILIAYSINTVWYLAFFLRIDTEVRKYECLCHVGVDSYYIFVYGDKYERQKVFGSLELSKKPDIIIGNVTCMSLDGKWLCKGYGYVYSYSGKGSEFTHGRTSSMFRNPLVVLLNITFREVIDKLLVQFTLQTFLIMMMVVLGIMGRSRVMCYLSVLVPIILMILTTLILWIEVPDQLPENAKTQYIRKYFGNLYASCIFPIIVGTTAGTILMYWGAYATRRS